MANKLSTWLAKELQDRKLSQRELARQSGISHSTIADVIAEKRDPTFDFCAAIAKPLGKLPQELFRMAELPGFGPVPSAVAEEEELLDYFRQMPPITRQIMVDIIKVVFQYLSAEAIADRVIDGLPLDEDTIISFRMFLRLWSGASPARRERLHEQLEELTRRYRDDH